MIDSLYSNLAEVLEMTWPMLFISIVLVFSLRVTYLLKHKEEFIFYKEMLLLLFMIYILVLFQIVTVQDINGPADGNNFIPFTEIFRYKLGGKLFVRNIVGNVLMFIPYGFFSTMYTDNKKLKVSFILITLAALSIETTQLSIGRIFDVDDILLNIGGGLIGYYLYMSLDKVGNIKPNILRSNTFLNIFSFLALVLALLLITSYMLVWR